MAVPRICPICGPKLSICCLVLSAWGIIFLGILGIFFYIESAGLFEDIGVHFKNGHYDPNEATQKYRSVAYNCWIATGGYIVTLIIALWQNKWNSRLASQ